MRGGRKGRAAPAPASPQSPALLPPVLSGCLDLSPLVASSLPLFSHLRVQCLYKRCLGINGYTRRPILFPRRELPRVALGVPFSPTREEKKKSKTWSARGRGWLLRAAAAG